MKVGWVQDDPGYIGGAELTMREFRAAAPCKVVDGIDAETVVVGNCINQRPEFNGQRVIQYHHDVRTEHHVDPDLHIYCSPLQRAYMGGDGPIIPPALDLETFRQVGQGQDKMMPPRSGAIWLGKNTGHPDKGFDLAQEWAQGNGKLNAYEDVPYDDVPRLLALHETFVHLPRAIEPFGRSVVEAWAAGLKLVVNQLIGARYWIEEDPGGLENAAERFWEAVLA